MLYELEPVYFDELEELDELDDIDELEELVELDCCPFDLSNVFFTLLLTIFLTFLFPPLPSSSSTSTYSKISSSLASSPYFISF